MAVGPIELLPDASTAIGRTMLGDRGSSSAGGGNWAGTGGITSSAAAGDSSHLTALGVIQNNQSGLPLYTPAKQGGVLYPVHR
jgi:hypothetical protein